MDGFADAGCWLHGMGERSREHLPESMPDLAVSSCSPSLRHDFRLPCSLKAPSVKPLPHVRMIPPALRAVSAFNAPIIPVTGNETTVSVTFLAPVTSRSPGTRSSNLRR
jgi:hypothetical protein